ncbi:MAG TPA: DUF4159 domain-containing protein [Thermodesulfobacteriota bacterium]|nr:DUF4159 domain-containing protein [Thermodesulfobacteriota bacterium]
MISRRQFLSVALGATAGLLTHGAKILHGASFPHFFFAQVKYRGGEWDPNPQFVEAIIEEMELRTSIDGTKERRVTTLSDPELFFCPFLYMTGKYEFDPFTPQEREILRRFLTFGGFLLAEDTMGARGFGFDRVFRDEMKQVFPRQELKRLPADHSVYQSFYLIRSIGGRQRVSPFLEGIVIDNWTPVIYSQNDLSGAWARDKFGKWVNECVPGGEAQRASAFKLGINIIVYSLTSDYKKDLVHHPFIKKRQNL